MSKTFRPAMIGAMSIVLSSGAVAAEPRAPLEQGNVMGPARSDEQLEANQLSASSEAQLLYMLRARGYDRIERVERKGANYEVHARKGGQTLTVIFGVIE